MSRIVSSMPGRIRVRDKGFRDPAKLNAFKERLLNIPAVTGLQDDARTGSVIVRFDKRAVTLAALEAAVESAAGLVLGEAVKTLPLLSKKNINRYNKIAMLTSLGASLVFVWARPRRWRRWHAATSYLFLAYLGVHLITYRKSLLRLFR